MTQEPFFQIGMLGGACEQGAKQAAALFERNKKYTLADMVAAGAAPQNVVWLLLRRSAECGETLKIMQAWARRACEEAGVPAGKLKTGEACFAAVKAAMRARNKAAGGSRGGKAWAYGHLVKMATEGKKDGTR